MASAGEPLSERECLKLIARQIADLHAEAQRLSRRLRNIRGTIHEFEVALGTLAAHIDKRLAELEPRPERE